MYFTGVTSLTPVGQAFVVCWEGTDGRWSGVLRERYLWLLICGESSKEGGLCPQLTYESESNTAGALTSCLALPVLITVTETSLPLPDLIPRAD